MKDALIHLVSHIVDHPDDISIEEQNMGEKSFQYIIHVNPEDIGKIIGRDGKIIQAIRNVAKVKAVKDGIQVRIEIGE